MTDEPGELDPDGIVPLYLQLAQRLRNSIVTGRIRPGAMLPSQSELHKRYGVSVETTRMAVSRLREEGLAVTRRGAGSFALPPPSKITVKVGLDDVVTARMPTRAERESIGVAPGVPVISVRRPGRAEELFDANRAEVIFTGLTA
jgi:DNA-binding GntR family transcriptional regulator